VVVNSMAALQSAVNPAPPGRNILIAPGTYTGTALTFNRNGTKANPIVIRSQNGLGTVTISGGTWTLADTSFWLVFEKLHVQAFNSFCAAITTASLDAGSANFGVGIRMETAHDCRIDHCDFSEENPNLNQPNGINFRGASQYGNGTAARNLIDYNYFHALGANSSAIEGFSDTSSPPVGNDTARGQSLIMDHNLFEGPMINGEYVVVMVSGTIWRFNTFLNLSGYFQNPCVAHCEYRSKWWENVDPTKAWSEDSLWIGNRFIGGEPLWVPAGSGSWEDQQSGAVPSDRYEPATNSRFIGNRFGSGRLQLGQYWNNGSLTLPANNILLEANTRDSGGNAHEFITTFLNPGATNVTVNTTTNEPFTPAVKLTANEVGVNPPGPLCG
jgi:Chondroitinase B